MTRFARFLKAFLVWTLSFQMVFQSLLIEAHAQSITPDAAAAAANQSTVTTAPGGTPMVNIVAPNGAGVSHNKYTNFNVTSSGLILNNATALANTQLGGLINANPNLGGTAARLILDEVTSANISTLSGALEIGGTKADYILANPNGITCSGCGFINTARTTLTTGTPTFTGSNLTGLSVNDGTIAIEGLGLDATKADKFDIVTRIAALNGQINGVDLGVYTGRQDFDYANRTTVAKAPDGSVKPTFSIDSTALGGMYGGRITLVGTEAGVGVRFAADMAASAGDMTLTADGKLVMKANATATGNVNLTSTTSSVDIAKDVYAGGAATATAATALNVAANATLGAAGNVTTSTATVSAGSGGQVVAGMDANGALTTAGTLNMTASTSIAPTNGFFGGGTDVRMTAPIIDFSRAVDDNSESVRSRGTMTLTTPNLTATNGRIAADGALTVTNTAGLTVGAGKINSATAVTLSGTSVATGATVVSDGTVAVTSSAGDITNTGSLSAGTTLALTSSANINNSGILKSQTGTTLTAGTNITNAATKLITSGTNTTLIAGGALTNAGDIYAPQFLTVTVPTINNTGTLASSVNLAVNTQSFTNTAGVLYAKNNFIVGGYGGVTNAFLFDNASGVVETKKGDITINADTFKNRKSAFAYAQSASYVSPILVSHGGACAKTNRTGGCRNYFWNNYRADTSIGSYSFMASNMPGAPPPYARYFSSTVSSNSASALVTSGKNISLSTNAFTNDVSTINAVGDINITANTANNQAVSLYSDLYVYRSVAGCTVSRFVTSSNGCRPRGTILAIRKAVSSEDSLIQAGGNLTITAPGGVRSGTEQVYAPPPPYTISTDSSALSSSPAASGIIAASAYADLIPGRDALFVISTAPKPKFLFETRAVFVDKGLYLGSDYFLGQFGDYDPEALPTRMGDAYFENQMVRQAILRETGQRWLNTAVKDDQAQMKALLDGGVQTGRDLDLAFGITLTAEHIAALTQDIIWYEETVYQGRTVLVPKLYLASATRAAVRAKFDNKGAVLAGTNVTVTADTIFNDKGIITASNDVNLTATGDLTSTSAEIIAGNDIALTSTDGNVQVQTQVDVHSVKSGEGGNNVFSIQHERSKVTAGGSLTVAANDTIAVLGSDIASTGNTTLTAGKAVDIGVVEMRRERHFGSDTIKETNNVTSTAVAGGTFTVASGGAVTVKGGSVQSGGDLKVESGGDLVVESAIDTYDAVGTRNKKGRFGKSKTGKSELHIATNIGAKLTSGGTLTLDSESGAVAVVASNLNASGNIRLDADNGKVVIGARKDKYAYTETATSSGPMKFRNQDTGKIDETVIHTTMKTDGSIIIETSQGVIADYKISGNFEESTAQLAALPGLDYIDQLKARSDVNWQGLSEAHDQWDYKAQGLGPGAAILISLAVMVATGGAGSAAVLEAGSTALSTSAAATAAVGTTAAASTAAAAAAAQTAFTSALSQMAFETLVSQAITSGFNNGGDIGAILKDLASMDTVKSLATNILTQGVTSAALGKLGVAGKDLNIIQKVQKGLAKATISASINTVVNGGKLSENLKSSVLTAAISLVGSEAANAIKLAVVDANLDPTNSQAVIKVTQLVAHAALGCGLGAASGGDCSSGAIGGVAGELTAWGYQSMTADDLNADLNEITNSNLSLEEQKNLVEAKSQKWIEAGVDLSRLSGALAATAVGGDAATASTTAGNAAENNALFIIPIILVAMEVIDKALMAKDAYDLAEAVKNDDKVRVAELSKELGISIAIEGTIGSVVPGSEIMTKLVLKLEKSGAGSIVINKVKGMFSGRIPSITSTNIADNFANAGLSTVDASSINKKFWTKKTEFSGNNVYQRNDLIDPNRLNADGVSNLQLMKNGNAPYGPDGNRINLHHMLQTQDGPIAEVTQTFHTTNKKVIHINPNTIPSGINRSQFDTWRGKYWENRANDFIK